MSNDHLTRKILFLATLIIISQISFSKNYYVNPSSSSIKNEGSVESPWQTLQEINNNSSTFQPGDSILFKRGEIYSGVLLFRSSGTQHNPIVYSSFGEGSAPLFTNTSKHCLYIYKQQFVVIDGFRITDKRINPSDHKPNAFIQYGIIIDESPNCVIKNCDISLIGIGIAINSGSDSTLVSGNTIHNLRMIRNTPGGNDDFGANGIVIGSSGNKILRNRFESCWGYSKDYEYDGGAIEFFGNTMNNNIIMYNTSINCAGFIEMGSDGKGEAFENLIAYNKIINNGYTGVFHNGDQFNTRIKKTKYFNNSIIETKRQFAYPKMLFWVADITATDVIEFRNNIVWLETGISFGINSNQTESIHHSNNIFKLLNGSVTKRKLNPTDMIASSVEIFYENKGNAEQWDLHLSEKSRAIDIGAPLGITEDFDGNTIQGKPDAGVYEYTQTITSGKKPAS